MAKKRNKSIDELVNVLREYCEHNLGDLSASSIVSNTDITLEDIKRSSELYNVLLSYLLKQGNKLKKHSHESVMEDFKSKFGENSDDNRIEVFFISGTDINMDDFKKDADDSELN